MKKQSIPAKGHQTLTVETSHSSTRGAHATGVLKSTGEMNCWRKTSLSGDWLCSSCCNMRGRDYPNAQ